MTNLFDSTLLDTDLFDTDGAIYMGSQRTPEHCDVGLFGVEDVPQGTDVG